MYFHNGSFKAKDPPSCLQFSENECQRQAVLFSLFSGGIKTAFQLNPANQLYGFFKHRLTNLLLVYSLSLLIFISTLKFCPVLDK